MPKSPAIDRGDVVEFSIARLHDSNIYYATELRTKQLKKDRLIALQNYCMPAAGAVREIGVVTAVKNNEYGFIRAQDRKADLYFRLDDFAEENVTVEEVRNNTLLLLLYDCVCVSMCK